MTSDEERAMTLRTMLANLIAEVDRAKKAGLSVDVDYGDASILREVEDCRFRLDLNKIHFTVRRVF